MPPIVANVPAAVFKMPSVLATESTAYIVLPELAMASRFNVVGVNVGVLEMMAYTHTCYEGKKPGCGMCPACILRKKGFKEAGIEDPMWKEG